MLAQATPTLAIITVTRNDVTGLRATVDSVLASQDLLRLEMLIVDGASTDGTREYLTGISNPSLRWISEPDAGIYDAMNKGTRLTTAPYLLWLNAGDTLHGRSALSNVLREIDAHAPLWLAAQARHLNGGRGPAYVIDSIPHVWWRHALGLQPHSHQSTIFSRRLVDVVGGYSEDYGIFGDFDFILRCGVVCPPLEIREVISNYEGDGRSAAAAALIPMTQHIIRRDRLSLSGMPLRFDRLFTRYRRIRLSAARFRRRLARAGREGK